MAFCNQPDGEDRAWRHSVNMKKFPTCVFHDQMIALRPFSPPNRLPLSFLHSAALRSVQPVPREACFPLHPHHSRGPGKQDEVLLRSPKKEGQGNV